MRTPKECPGNFLAICLVMALVGIGTLSGQLASSHGVHVGEPPAQGSSTTGLEVKILMKDGLYHVRNSAGESLKELVLRAGEVSTILLQNQDPVAHEFITPLFTRTEVRFSGDAVGIFGKEAAGFRLDPGKVLRLQFQAPYIAPFATMFDVVWCTLHKTAGGEPQEGEILLVATNETSH